MHNKQFTNETISACQALKIEPIDILPKVWFVLAYRVLYEGQCRYGYSIMKTAAERAEPIKENHYD